MLLRLEAEGKICTRIENMLLKICFVLQQDGKLPFVPGDKEMVLGVSKYGVKVASLDQCVSRWSGYSSDPLKVSHLVCYTNLTDPVFKSFSYPGCAASTPSVSDSAHVVLR